MTQGLDRRVVRTRHRLRDALVALVSEKPYDEVTVGELLQRADVGRATFYAHFRDKEDLLVSLYLGMIDFMERGAADAGEVLPVVRPLLNHFQDAKTFGRGLMRSGKMDMLLRAAETRLQRTAEARLGDPVAAVFAAGAFVTLVKWWMAQGLRPSADEMADRYEALVGSGVRGA